MRRINHFTLLFYFIFVGCGVEQAGELNEPSLDREPDVDKVYHPYITNGQVDTGHPSVGKLTSSNAGCTATLVGKRTVLTAGHCVRVNGTSTFAIGGKRYTSSRIIRHSRYGGGNRNDIALVILSQAPTGITPSPIAISGPKVGQSITLVGYGLTGEYKNDYGTKRKGTNTIASVGSTTFSFRGQSNVCNGDSGGPTFIASGAQEIVAGVHSTKSGFCGNGGTDMRVDAYQQWIKTQSNGDVVLAGGTTPPSPSNCHQGSLFGGDYCSASCPCDNGEGDCDNDSECKAGLICKMDVGQKYGVSNTVDVCENPTDSSSAEAKEGESCASNSCAGDLTCVPVYNSSTSQAIGKYCMEKCTTLGADPVCDGGESCTQSRASGRVCFNPNNPDQGYTSP